MDKLELIAQRHSVRQYKDIAIEGDKRKVIDDLVSSVNSEHDLNFQVLYDEEECFNSAMAHYGKLVGVKNYIALVGKKSSNLEEKIGYYGEHIVLKLQDLGLNTCWVALTHGKSKAIIDKGEKEVCLIAFGYGQNQGVAHKSKSLKEISNYQEGMPEWYLKGLECALLAPTAINQQKFYFELDGDEVKLKKGKGFYTGLDLGIVRYHFEIGAKRKI